MNLFYESFEHLGVQDFWVSEHINYGLIFVLVHIIRDKLLYVKFYLIQFLKTYFCDPKLESGLEILGLKTPLIFTQHIFGLFLR